MHSSQATNYLSLQISLTLSNDILQHATCRQFNNENNTIRVRWFTLMHQNKSEVEKLQKKLKNATKTVQKSKCLYFNRMSATMWNFTKNIVFPKFHQFKFQLNLSTQLQQIAFFLSGRRFFGSPCTSTYISFFFWIYEQIWPQFNNTASTV